MSNPRIFQQPLQNEQIEIERIIKAEIVKIVNTIQLSNPDYLRQMATAIENNALTYSVLADLNPMWALTARMKLQGKSQLDLVLGLFKIVIRELSEASLQQRDTLRPV